MATKSKFSLAVKPTFKARVDIPVPGDAAAKVEFIFKGRTRDEFKEFIDSLKDREDVDVVMDIASGWELDEAFDAESVEILCQNYLGAARAIIEKYLAELTQARLGN
jgi:hypothetical protein